MNKPLIIYHAHCLDGFTAAWAASLVFGKDAVYLPMQYGQVPTVKSLRKYARVYVLDFSFQRAVIQEWIAVGVPFEIHDHHKTAKADLDGLPGVTFDMARSGAMLAWNRFHPGVEPPDLVRYVQDRDLWRWELPDSKAYCAALNAYPMDAETWSLLLDRTEDLKAEGKILLRYERQLIERACEQSVLRTIGGHEVLVVNTTVCGSEIGERLCLLNPHLPFSAFYSDTHEGTRKWGLRSRNGFDVSAVAKLYGGGGHAAAAGFTSGLDWLGDV